MCSSVFHQDRYDETLVSSVNPPVPKSVAIVVYPNCELFELYSAISMLSSQFSDTKCYEFYCYLYDKESLPSNAANAIGKMFPIVECCSFEIGMNKFILWDVVVVPGSKGQPAIINDGAFLTKLRSLCAVSEKVITLGTGSLLLAKTGLLDGKRSTTKKEGMKKLTVEFPTVKWIEAARWTDDGKYLCSSGGCAGMVTVSSISDV